MTLRTTVLAAAAVLSLGACGDRPQTLGATANKSDAQAWSVSDAAKPAYQAAGWKAGDKAAWEEQLRKRNQAQNEYVR